jgi:hypothetical protein
MTTRNEPKLDNSEIRKPVPWDLKKGMEIAKKVIKENEAWLKEMAKR